LRWKVSRRYAAGVAKGRSSKRKHPIAVALAKLRAKKLTAEQRREIARKAAAARWGRSGKSKSKPAG
jgi:hypothetical protein